MPKVLDQVDRDRVIWEEYIAGRRQRDIAQDRGLAQSSVSEAIARYRNQLPPLDRAEELDRAVELINALIHVHVPRALQGHLGHTRMVDRLVTTKAKLAGIAAPTRVEHQGQIDHAHAWVPGPSVDQVLNQWREQGLIQAQITRMDTP
jgi:predicted transcriptional regulator